MIAEKTCTCIIDCVKSCNNNKCQVAWYKSYRWKTSTHGNETKAIKRHFIWHKNHGHIFLRNP